MSKPLASIGQRFTSQFLDDLVATAVGVLFYFGARALELPLELAFLGFVLYVLFCDGFPGGQSLGKRFTRTAVVHANTEEPCRYWQSLVRNFAMFLGLIDAVFILGKQRRRLGDYFAGTKVVQSEPIG
jgi:uncharacterized RDD family membrane protein YckC